jgi:transcriptional regulator with XRE-family HTH domain
MNIGPVIRNFRQHQNLTLEALAELMEMSVSHLSLIERNKREPSLECLSQLGLALDVPPSVLLLLATEPKKGVKEDSITQNLRSLINDLLHDDERFPTPSLCANISETLYPC